MGLRWLAIVNAHAGHFRAERWQTGFVERLRDELGARTVFTQYPGHACELAQAAPEDGLAVFGGDGTLAEAVNGMDLARQRLLVLPGGTGNGLARDLGFRSLERAFLAARGGGERGLDLIEATFRAGGRQHFRLAISTVAVGYAAEVVRLANRRFKALGSWCYPLAATLQAGRQKSFPVSIGVNGSEPLEARLSNVMVNNTRHAGNFSAFRQADLGDGCVEVLLARAGAAQQMLHNIAVLSKTYFYRTAAETCASSMDVQLDPPQRLMLDGELWDEVTHLTLNVAPNCLRCIV